MFKKKYAVALLSALFSLTAFNTLSYAKLTECPKGQDFGYNEHVYGIGYKPDSSSITAQIGGDNVMNKVTSSSMVQAVIQPLLVAAFTSGTPVASCTITNSEGGSDLTNFSLQKDK
ncbi:hypothetical protein COMNV_01343 [Commensalibacter sp. Nvir]|uniref:hypothetical protein n=1 Tax=Commensalibacter sp. Nvir TaxID=3069817 RepID=UPI002D4E5F29|nr:hypothetical protein COMNV_01343 [Commensalibacter sp. Nvir]